MDKESLYRLKERLETRKELLDEAIKHYNDTIDSAYDNLCDAVSAYDNIIKELKGLGIEVEECHDEYLPPESMRPTYGHDDNITIIEEAIND